MFNNILNNYFNPRNLWNHGTIGKVQAIGVVVSWTTVIIPIIMAVKSSYFPLKSKVNLNQLGPIEKTEKVASHCLKNKNKESIISENKVSNNEEKEKINSVKLQNQENKNNSKTPEENNIVTKKEEKVDRREIKTSEKNSTHTENKGNVSQKEDKKDITNIIHSQSENENDVSKKDSLKKEKNKINVEIPQTPTNNESILRNTKIYLRKIDLVYDKARFIHQTCLNMKSNKSSETTKKYNEVCHILMNACSTINEKDLGLLPKMLEILDCCRDLWYKECQKLDDFQKEVKKILDELNEYPINPTPINHKRLAEIYQRLDRMQIPEISKFLTTIYWSDLKKKLPDITLQEFDEFTRMANKVKNNN